MNHPLFKSNKITKWQTNFVCMNNQVAFVKNTSDANLKGGK